MKADKVLLFNDIAPERLETIVKLEDSYCDTRLMEGVKKSLFYWLHLILDIILGKTKKHL